MTPAQRKYDEDLVLAMQMMANWIEPRSRKVSVTLRLAAERIQALASSLPVDENKIQPQVKQPRPHAQPIKIQPASKPDEANKPNP